MKEQITGSYMGGQINMEIEVEYPLSPAEREAMKQTLLGLAHALQGVLESRNALNTIGLTTGDGMAIIIKSLLAGIRETSNVISLGKSRSN